MSVLSGPDLFDPNVPPVKFNNSTDVDISSLKVAYFTDNGIVKPTQDIVDVILRAVKFLSSIGMKVEEARPIGIEKTFKLHWQPFFTMCDGGKNVSRFLEKFPDYQVSQLRKQYHEDAKQLKLYKLFTFTPPP